MGRVRRGRQTRHAGRVRSRMIVRQSSGQFLRRAGTVIGLQYPNILMIYQLKAGKRIFNGKFIFEFGGHAANSTDAFKAVGIEEKTLHAA